MVEPFSRKEFGETLNRQILPRVEGGTATLVPAHPTLASRVVRVTPQPAPLLRAIRGGRSFTLAAHWVEEGFNSARFPTLIWVAEGEADFRLGITRRMAMHDKRLSAKHGVYVVTLPAHSFFLVPPGVPISDASRPHWERPHLERAQSRLCWFHVLPAGVSLHSCTTRGQTHTSSRALFFSETRLLPLVEALLEELQSLEDLRERLARHYLATFLLHTQRVLGDNRAPKEENNGVPSHQVIATTTDTPMQRACRYIETHLNERMTLQRIATNSYISASHLNRLFRAAFGQSISQYVTCRRMEQARSLLETTDLPVNRVGVLCGYLHAEQFGRVFARHHGMPPRVFRNQSRGS